VATELAQLNRQQARLFRLLASWREPELPTLSLLAERLQFTNESGVRYHLRALEATGLVDRASVGAANFRPPVLSAKGRELAAQDEPCVPLYEGGLHAGDCGVQYEPDARPIRELRDLFSLWDDEYFVRVKGTCMDGGVEPIRNGDIVLMRPASRRHRPDNGVVAHVELPLGTGQNEPLLREYSFDEASGLQGQPCAVTLRCYNPAPGEEAETTYSDEEVEVRGVLVSIVRDVNGFRLNRGSSK
jgi:SOS-response transcriptional repressor LexA